jgi:hypothetical protein
LSVFFASFLPAKFFMGAESRSRSLGSREEQFAWFAWFAQFAWFAWFAQFAWFAWFAQHDNDPFALVDLL